MKRLLIIPLIALFTITANAQTVELFPEQDKGTNFYFEGNAQAVGAGFQFSGITAGASHLTKDGQNGLFVDTRITPTLVQAFGIKVIAGLGGSAGYLMDSRNTKTNWSAVYGVRIPKYNLEITRSRVFQYGNEYSIPVSVRWYLD